MSPFTSLKCQHGLLAVTPNKPLLAPQTEAFWILYLLSHQPELASLMSELSHHLPNILKWGQKGCRKQPSHDSKPDVINRTGSQGEDIQRLCFRERRRRLNWRPPLTHISLYINYQNMLTTFPNAHRPRLANHKKLFFGLTIIPMTIHSLISFDFKSSSANNGITWIQ